MSFPAGTEFGPYRILGQIGSGGMGEVYRAQDTRLNRVVAIKVLLESSAADPDRLRRFEQEAQTLAALNHPNILAVHDLGTREGQPYLVSEFLEGVTLRNQLHDGPLPARKAIEYALGIANGLAAGHSKGIVHRDIKPENIFITQDGRVKILDFGLAKLLQAATADSVETLRTSGSGTTPGVVLGTVGYMSPEQVRGEPAEATSDIFSFGSVLYEMLSGKRAFKRDTAAETMTAVLREDPPELSSDSGSGAMISPGMQRILRRCMEKNPRLRFQSASDLAFAMDALSGSGTQYPATHDSAAGLPGTTAIVRAKSWRFWALSAFAVLLLCAGCWWLATKFATKPVANFQQLTFQRGYINEARYAKDGQTVFYSGVINDAPMQAYTLQTDLLQPVKIQLPDATLYAVSNRGQMAIGLNPVPYLNSISATLASAPISGGTPRPIQNDVLSADFAPDGITMAMTRYVNGKARLEYPAGHVLYEISTGYLDAVRVSPDGKLVAFAVHPTLGDNRGWLSVADQAGKVRQLIPDSPAVSGATWVKNGQEIWFGGVVGEVDSGLFSVNLAGKLKFLLGGPGNVYLHDVSADGQALIGLCNTQFEVTGGDAAGKETPHLEFYDASGLTDISSDGKAILMSDSSGASGDLYQVLYRKIDGSPALKLGSGDLPVLSPDGTTVAAVLESSPPTIIVYPLGTGESRKLVPGNLATIRSVAWSADGKHLAVTGAMPNEKARSFVLDLDSGKLESLGPSDFLAVAISKDGESFIGRTPSGWETLHRNSARMEPVPGLNASDEVQRYTQDGRGILFSEENGLASTTAYRLDLATGKRTALKTVQVSDKAVVQGVHLMMAGDEKSYAYATSPVQCTLYETTSVR